MTAPKFVLITIWLAHLLIGYSAPSISAPQGNLNSSSSTVEQNSQTIACDSAALSETKSKTLALQSINAHFERLAKGELEHDFSLSAIFTINLLDEPDTANRITALTAQRGQLTKSSYIDDCADKHYQQAFAQFQSLSQSVTQSRLNYLKLAYEQRLYLVTLLDIHTRILRRLESITSELEPNKAQLNVLKAELEMLEAEFQFLEDADRRVALTNAITVLNLEQETLIQEIASSTKIKTKNANLLSLAQVLLRDFYRFNIESNYQESETHRIFQSITSYGQLKKLLFFQKTDVQEIDEQALADYASLILLTNRIYGVKRQNNHFASIFTSPLSETASRIQFEFESLLALPFAHLHLKLTNRNAEPNFLSRTLSQSLLQLIIQFLVIFVFWKLLNHLPGWLSSWQRGLIRNHLSKAYSRHLIGLLRILQPNAPWLMAVIFFGFLETLDRTTLGNWLVLYNITAIFAIYLFIRTLATWPISNTMGRTQVFVTQARQTQVHKDSTHYASLITVLSILDIVLKSILNGGLIYSIYSVLIILGIWYFSFHLIAKYEKEFVKHLSMQFSDAKMALFARANKPVVKTIIYPVLFIVLQGLDIISGIHMRLLRIEKYQTLSAKFLKMRLEQTQPTETEAVENDIDYENYFNSPSLMEENPKLLVKTPWLASLNETIESWLTEKQDENDLVVIGATGVGKTTLAKQWLAQWDQCRTVFIDLKDKIVTEKGIFSLVTESLGFKGITDIPSFVNHQKETEKTVVVLDNAHNLFLADVRGFEAYKALHNLANANLKNIFWIIIINQQSWIYLNDVFGRVYRFSSKLQLQRWSQQDIRQLILNRQRASGRRLTYDELLLASTSHSETAARAAEARCFSLLWDQSSGIPSIALSIWLNAKRSPRASLIEMGIPERPSSTAFVELIDDQLFVYAALVVHEVLNTQQAQAVTHLPEAVVRRALKLGLDQGFLNRREQGKYIINPLWYIQLCQLLKRKNFLHE